METIFEIRCGQAAYPVLFGSDAGEALARVWRPAWRQGIIIADSHTAALFSDRIAIAIGAMVRCCIQLQFKAGERSKTRTTKAKLEDAMLAARGDRDACIVAVGGGVVLDMAGFVAATYMRGIAHINVPTTLLAQVDAAIGGKTGVNTGAGKNLIGAFHQPQAVIVDPSTLRTLPPSEIRSGLAEMVKHAVVADAGLFRGLEVWAATGERIPATDLISRSIMIKARTVAEDERDGGMRQILNFGHTAGHAIEKATSHRVRHGDAVAAGMMVEAAVAHRFAGFPETALSRLRQLLATLGLPIRPQCAFDDALGSMLLDKKRTGDEIRCALPSEIGAVRRDGDGWTVAVPPELMRSCWEDLRR